MKGANRRWGCRKIQGELAKVGIKLSKSSIAVILKSGGYPPNSRKSEETWLSFLKSHTSRYFACDFLTVETAFLKRLYVFVIMDVTNREIVAFNITSNPIASWLENFVRSSFMDLENLPNCMVSDRDGVYGEWFGAFLKDSYDMRLYRTPPKCPNCNAFIERWNRTLREELLDHRIVFGRRDLYKLIDEYVHYYHFQRPHQSLNQDSSLRTHKRVPQKILPNIRRQKVVDGLVTNFELAS